MMCARPLGLSSLSINWSTYDMELGDGGKVGSWTYLPQSPQPDCLFCLPTDFAVGAPFDGDGKVFIYHGSSVGVVVRPSQVRGLVGMREWAWVEQGGKTVEGREEAEV